MKASVQARRTSTLGKLDTQPISRLGFALLGLIQQKPASGYDLRRLFSTTALGTFSDSPGAIYPALARLEKQGLICGRVEKSGLRQRQVFRVTASGVVALQRWLRQPIGRHDLVHGSDSLMLRFAFMDGVVGRDASVEFLGALASALESYVTELRAYLEQHKSEMPVSAMLALEAGIRGYETTLQWAHHGLEVYALIQKGGTR